MTKHLYPEPPPPDRYDEKLHEHEFQSSDPNVFFVFSHGHLDYPGHSHLPEKMLEWAKRGEGLLQKYTPNNPYLKRNGGDSSP